MTDFDDKLRDQLRAKEKHLPPEVESRLKEARRTACEQPQRSHVGSIWIPVTGMALASVIGLAILLTPPLHINLGGQQVVKENTLPQQDLDFYYWLAETQDVTES